MVCAQCAYGCREQTECPVCARGDRRTRDIFARFGLKTGRSEQVDCILEHHNKSGVLKTRSRLKVENANAYAQAMISAEATPFANQLAPLINTARPPATPDLPEGREKTGRSLKCWLCCCPCLVMLDASKFSIKVAIFLIERMIFAAAFLIIFAVILGIADVIVYPGLIEAIAESPGDYKPYLGMLFLFMILCTIVGPWIVGRIQRAVDLRIERRFGK